MSTKGQKRTSYDYSMTFVGAPHLCVRHVEAECLGRLHDRADCNHVTRWKCGETPTAVRPGDGWVIAHNQVPIHRNDQCPLWVKRRNVRRKKSAQKPMSAQHRGDARAQELQKTTFSL